MVLGCLDSSVIGPICHRGYIGVNSARVGNEVPFSFRGTKAV